MEEVFPKVSFYIFGIPVRDTVVSTWVTMALIIGVVWVLRKTLPTALVMVVEFLRDTVADVIGDRSVEPFVPFLGSLMLFLLIANNVGVLPFVGTPTRDINAGLALAIVVFFAVHYFGFREKGIKGYLKEQATPMVVLNFISEISRTLSLSLRLFGNIIAGEIIVAVMYRLVGPIVPLAMVALSLITGVLQAYIFMIIATSAIAAAVRGAD